MSEGAYSNFRIREINPESSSERSLVASRMRQTLVEVLGEEKGAALYSMDWLLERVGWHLDVRQTTAKIFLVEDHHGEICAHAIARIERDGNSQSYGYFSTVFVDPTVRDRGIATRLILHVESWLREMSMPRVVYNTAENHSKLIGIFERQGYLITARQSTMAQLTKMLSQDR
jgi:GNAT superfamily N-acetyltransferase